MEKFRTPRYERSTDALWRRTDATEETAAGLARPDTDQP